MILSHIFFLALLSVAKQKNSTGFSSQVQYVLLSVYVIDLLPCHNFSCMICFEVFPDSEEADNILQNSVFFLIINVNFLMRVIPYQVQKADGTFLLSPLINPIGAAYI